ncbi:response regulator [Paenibacillus campinasensis]|uniref:Response regulator n=1 Tax=Paenibacillus campinasensis TaxID=66347 RepID=A0ABW9T4B9_9BACL|nr:response regulator [Paenibacillus campinasensis]MUG67922.1 response regulator [Paenibacillus campinasensis]
MRRQYRVLIADDEPIIREGIRDAVRWEELGMEVACEAEDGEEALELALQYHIDIALVDMNMPFMDGIALMKRLKEERPSCRFVIVTGHDEFAYAQEAIRLGVKEYILKPVNAEHLNQVLRSVKQELDELHVRDLYFQKASEQIEKNIPLLRERFCLEWIHGLISHNEALEQLEFLGLPPRLPLQIGIVRWPETASNQPLMKEGERQLYLFAIENIIAELIHDVPHMLFREQTGLIGICLWEELPVEAAVDMEKAVLKYIKRTVNVHLEPVESELGGVSEAYDACREAVFRESQLSPIVRRARQLIHEVYAQHDLTLEAFAAGLQVSPVYLSRMLKKELGTSFVGFLTQTRIRKAIELLTSTDHTIHEIAEQVGYDSQHYFSTAFKKVMGVSPNRYRKGAAYAEE